MELKRSKSNSSCRVQWIIAYIWAIAAATCGAAFAQDKVDPSPITGYCAILEDPASFVGKDVELKSELVFGWSYHWFSPIESCGVGLGVRQRFSVEYDENYRVNSSRKALKKFDRVLKEMPAPSPKNIIRGAFVVSVCKYVKKNEYDTRFDYEIWVKRILRVDRN